jgi:hypothetical protein
VNGVDARDNEASFHLARAIRDRKPVNIYGPTGSGKTRIARLTAELNGWPTVIIPIGIRPTNITTAAETLCCIPAVRPLFIIVEEADRLPIEHRALVVKHLGGQSGALILISQRALPEAAPELTA